MQQTVVAVRLLCVIHGGVTAMQLTTLALSRRPNLCVNGTSNAPGVYVDPDHK